MPKNFLKRFFLNRLTSTSFFPLSQTDGELHGVVAIRKEFCKPHEIEMTTISCKHYFLMTQVSRDTDNE